jgi:predicted transcriptional regulator
MRNIKLTFAQVQNLKHTQKKGSFVVRGSSKDLDEMVEAELLKRVDSRINYNEHVYFITEKGRKFLLELKNALDK